jgi:hypothetical protein
MTLDEIWFDFSNQHEQISLPKEENLNIIAPHMIRSPKRMLTLVCNPSEFHLVSVLFKGQTCMSQYYINNILFEICALRDEKDQRRLVVHVNNAKWQGAKIVKHYMEDHNMRIAPHSAYSPDLTPSDFFLFDQIQKTLRKAELQSLHELLDAMI